MHNVICKKKERNKEIRVIFNDEAFIFAAIIAAIYFAEGFPVFFRILFCTRTSFSPLLPPSVPQEVKG